MSDEVLPENWLIVGLGNPGPDYDQTRHNVGFEVVDRLAARWGIQVKRTECRALIGQASAPIGKIELVKPQTYMNLSGESVKCLLENRDAGVDGLIVVVDDLAIPFGTIRIRPKGSAGGHNGLKSLNECLKTQDFKRIRIGIAPEHQLSNTKRYVLDKFPQSQTAEVSEIIDTAADAVEFLIENGTERAMSRFNTKP